MSKSNSNFRGSFKVCDAEYRFGDLGAGKGDLVICMLERAGVVSIWKPSISPQPCSVLRNPCRFVEGADSIDIFLYRKFRGDKIVLELHSDRAGFLKDLFS